LKCLKFVLICDTRPLEEKKKGGLKERKTYLSSPFFITPKMNRFEMEMDMIIRNWKLDTIISAILLGQQLNSNGHKVTIWVTSDNGLARFSPDDLCDIFKKLERDEKLFKIVQHSYPNHYRYGWNDQNPYFLITLKDTFNDWVKTYAKQLSDKEIDQQRKIALSAKVPAVEPEPMLKITYTNGREIFLNNIFLIGKPDFNGENDLVFSYLFKNPNKPFTKNEIERVIGEALQKSLHKIVENLGFGGDLKKVFFSVSKDSIQFNNPISKKQMGIEYLKLG
jgi:hypothetical protein